MKIIKIFILSIVSLIFTINGYGQSCKIEFYLLKKEIARDSTNLMTNFSATIEDLENEPFITNNEIISFSIINHTTDNRIVESHFFEVSESVTMRIKELKIPLCCGKPFALLVNGSIAYTGYFWNFYSSFGCDGICAVAGGDTILIERKLPDYGLEDGVLDKRQDSDLFDCLKATNRMKEE